MKRKNLFLQFSNLIKVITLILNLKQLNKNIEYHRFKMESINTILNFITKDCFMTSVDLFPNCLAPFSTKVPRSDLRLRKFVASGYIADFFTKDHTREDCFNNVMNIAELFDRLGFVVHQDKSVLVPTQEITILGFVINSRKMSVKLTPQKENNLRRLENQLFSMKNPSIRFLAEVIGTIVSVFPAAKYAPLNYRALENDKIRASEICKGYFHSHHPISDDVKYDLKWWKDNQMENCIHPPIIDPELFCDALDFAWGGVFETKPKRGA